MYVLSIFVNKNFVSAIVVEKKTLNIVDTFKVSLPFEPNTFYINNTRNNLEKLIGNIKSRFSNNHKIDKVIVTSDSSDVEYKIDYMVEAQSKLDDYVSIYIDPFNKTNIPLNDVHTNKLANHVYYKQPIPDDLNGRYHSGIVKKINKNLKFNKYIVSTNTNITDTFLSSFILDFVSDIQVTKTDNIEFLIDSSYLLIPLVSASIDLNLNLEKHTIKSIVKNINIKVTQSKDNKDPQLVLADQDTKDNYYNFVYNA